MSHNPRLTIQNIFPQAGVQATLLKIKDYSLLINCGIRQPYADYFEQYKQLAPDLSAIIITSPSQLSCGALPFLRNFGYRGQFFIPDFLFDWVRLTIEDLRYQAILDYSNHIPIDEHLQPLINQTNLFSIEQRRDLQLNSWIVLSQSVSVYVIKQQIDSVVLSLKTDYFKEKIFVAGELFRVGRYVLDNFQMDDLQLVICQETRKIKSQNKNPSVQVFESFRKTVGQNGQIYIPCDGVGSFLRIYENLQQEIKQVNHVKKISVGLICDENIASQLVRIQTLKEFKFIDKFDDSDIIFGIDSTFQSGFSRQFLKEKMSQNRNNKLILTELSNNFLKDRIYSTLIAAKLRNKNNAKVGSFEVEIRPVSENKTKTLRDKIGLNNNEVLVEDLHNEIFANKYDVNEFIDIANSINQLKYEEIYREEGKNLLGKKLLVLTKEQKEYILQFLQNKTRDGLFLADFNSSVIKSHTKAELTTFRLDRDKTYEIEFTQPNKRENFVKDILQLQFLKFYTELILEKNNIIFEDNQILIQPIYNNQSTENQNLQNSTVIFPSFKSIFDNSEMNISRQEIDINQSEVKVNKVQQKAEGNYIPYDFTISCQIDIVDFDFYASATQITQNFSKLIFNDNKFITDPSIEEIEKFGSTQRYLYTQVPQFLSYEMYNISHWINLIFTQNSHYLQLNLPGGQKILQTLIDVEDEIQIENKFHNKPLSGGIITVPGEMVKIEDIFKENGIGKINQENWQGELCGVETSYDENKKMVQKIQVTGRVSGALMDMVQKLKNEFGGEFQ